MNRSTPALAAVLALTTAAASFAGPAEKDLKAFPPAAEGMTRYVIELPHKERGEDDDFRVQLIVGKTILTDGVNRYMIGGGALEAKTAQGWGYTYYEASAFGPVASTRMAAIGGAAPEEKFVAASTEMLPYNSRIPLVVYVPKDGEVRYRIWKAAPDTQSAEEG